MEPIIKLTEYRRTYRNGSLEVHAVRGVSLDIHAGEFVAVSGYGDCAPGYICLASGYGEGGYEPTASLLRPESEGPFRESIRQLLA